MATVKEVNQSDQRLVVHSLKVLSSVEGGGIQEIKDNVSMLQQSHTTLAEATYDYWSQIASDSVITPEEKKTLYKEWQTIYREEPALLKEANEAGIGTGHTFYNAYVAAYNALYTYLYSTYDVFGNMQVNTEIADRTAFLNLYESYYSDRDTLRSAIYGTNSVLNYVIDLTPEMQSVPVDKDGNFRNLAQTVYIQVHLYKSTGDADYAVSRAAYYNGDAVGTWDGDTVGIPVTVFTGDNNYISITVTDGDGQQFSVKATVAKLYAGEDGGEYTYYDLELSEGCVRVDSSKSIDPERISVTKLKRTSNYTRETTYGTVTAAVDDGDEVEIGNYNRDTGTGYDGDTDYAARYVPTVIYLDSYHEKVLGFDGNTAIMFMNRS